MPAGPDATREPAPATVIASPVSRQHLPHHGARIRGVHERPHQRDPGHPRPRQRRHVARGDAADGLAGAVIGAFIMGVMNNGMSILGIGIDYQQVIKGLVLLAAVIFDVYNKQKQA